MPERPLITVSTHTATIDDAVMWPILPMKYWGLDPDKFRWVLGAQGGVLLELFMSYYIVITLDRINV